MSSLDGGRGARSRGDLCPKANKQLTGDVETSRTQTSQEVI